MEALMPLPNRPYLVLPIQVASEDSIGTSNFNGPIKADQVYSDHMPQVGTFLLKGEGGEAKIRVLTFNVALSVGPLLFFAAESPLGSERLIKRTLERDWNRSLRVVNAISKMLEKQKDRAPIDCIILQEAPQMLTDTEQKGVDQRFDFYNKLLECIGGDWRVEFSETKPGNVVLYNSAVLTSQLGAIGLPDQLKHQVQTLRFQHEKAKAPFVLHNVHFQWDDNQRVLEKRLEKLLPLSGIKRESVFFCRRF